MKPFLFFQDPTPSEDAEYAERVLQLEQELARSQAEVNRLTAEAEQARKREEENDRRLESLSEDLQCPVCFVLPREPQVRRIPCSISMAFQISD